MIDPEKGWSPYTVSQAARAECLREPYSRIAVHDSFCCPSETPT